MKPCFDRFQPPTAADELAMCQHCHTMFHYTELNSWGYCADCRDEEEDEEE